MTKPVEHRTRRYRMPSGPKQWTPDRILDALRAWNPGGEPPRALEWSPSACRALGLHHHERWESEHPRWPSLHTVQDHWGSWRAALTAAGYTSPPPLEGTASERARHAQRLAAEGLSVAAIADALTIGAGTAGRYLKARPCRRCRDGLVINDASHTCRACAAELQRNAPLTTVEAIDALRAWMRETGAAPVMRSWRPDGHAKWTAEEPRWPHYTEVTACLGTWTDALAAAGLTEHVEQGHNGGRFKQRWPPEAILAALNVFRAANGRYPSARELQSPPPELPQYMTVNRAFGSLPAAQQQAEQLHEFAQGPDEPDPVWVTRARAARGWSLHHLAELAEIPVTQLQRLEDGGVVRQQSARRRLRYVLLTGRALNAPSEA